MDDAIARLGAGTAERRTESGGSCRRRLWELSRKCHCPVVGVCFGVDQLRVPAVKVTHFTRATIDCESHTTAIAEIDTRPPLARILRRTRKIATR